MYNLEALLRGWGMHYREDRRDYEREHISRAERTVSHALARVRITEDRAPRAERRIVGRDGTDRRTIMGRAAGIRIVPMHFVDPVPCTSRGGGGGGGCGSGRPVPLELQRVEQAVKALERSDLLRALCLRATYCVEGDREEKALWVTDEFRKSKHDAERVTVNVLKNETAFAKVWVEARLSWGHEAAVPQAG